MKIYCLSTHTSVSDYCGFLGNRIVSSKRAIEDYVTLTKERILFILSRKPYLIKYPVDIQVLVRELDCNGVFKVFHQYTITLSVNSDKSFLRSFRNC